MSHGRYSNTNLLFFSVIFLLTGLFGLFAQDGDTIPIPLYIDDVYEGEVSVTILPDESVQIRPSELIAYLEAPMTDEAIETALKIFPDTGWMNLTDMSGLGVRIVFRFEDLTMHVNIPAHLRRETIVSFKSQGRDPEGEFVEQAPFSAFMNLSFWNRFTYESLDYDVSFTPELGLNIYNWVVEASISVRTGDIFYWDYSRLVKDFNLIDYRLEVGDLTMPVTDLIGVSSLLGASFRKNYELIDSSMDADSFSKEIFLREPSKVEIYLNDRKIREKDYQSGSYLFTDFPLNRGINSISIRWEDSEGEHEESVVIPFDETLLSAGEMDLGVAAGIPDREITWPAVTAYQYLGITDQFTFGVNESFNIDTLELNIHPDFILTTSFGNFQLVPIWGIRFNGGQYIDANLGYQMLKHGSARSLNFGGSINYAFNSISYPEQPLSLLSFDGSIGLSFGSGFSLTPEASFGWRFDESRPVFYSKAVLKKSIRGGSAVSATVGVEYDEAPAFSATVSYSSSFPGSNQNLYLLQNLETQQLSAYWNRYSTEESRYSLNASAELPMQLDDKISLGLSGGYEHDLFSVRGGHNFDTTISTSTSSNSTFLSADTGMVYAGGIFLLSKPVYDSFIIIDPEAGFEDRLLHVNPKSGGSDLELTGNPGVLSGINSFSLHKVDVEPEELPLGMDDSGMKYLAYPSYKSAFIIQPHAEIMVYIGGFLKNDEDKAYEAMLGRITGKNSGESVDFFTDENGYFEAYGLPAGIHILELNDIDAAVEINLTEAEGGFYNAGTITLTED
ncbi:MAG: hypothetical protein PQJ61_08170 [Spirochaetales bacterium]|uniref:Fimbrial biogenesis outer membrane usher protein n=1 Tax=Candidatus Thalassospirochaeta sargassi TaxID=3119039 RepID=A0AAJ1MKE0_9SPIO|nr:hypothetical protein [Spirochaetales bacterium]